VAGFTGIRSDDLEKAKKALEQGANANIKEPYSGATILAFSAFNGNLAMVKLLLDYDADINRGGQDQSTPLHEAVLQGHLSVAKLLIKKGANINARNRKGETPLDLAVRHIDMTKLLKKHGAREGQSLEEGRSKRKGVK